MNTKAHKAQAPRRLKIAVISVSSTRSLAEDKSGHWINKRARREGHEILDHRVVADDMSTISETLTEIIAQSDTQVVLMTGGTGISTRDVTIEAVRPLFDKELTSFAPLFAQLSFDEIDSAAIMSRATAI